MIIQDREGGAGWPVLPASPSVLAVNRRVRGTGVVAAVLATGLAGFSLTGCTPSQPAFSVSTGPTSCGPEFDAGLSTPVADPLNPQYGNPALDVLHYKLVLSWSPPWKELTGTATLTIRATRPLFEIALDFSDAYTVDEAGVDGLAGLGFAEVGSSIHQPTVPSDKFTSASTSSAR
jgi:hypothetical protein